MITHAVLAFLPGFVVLRLKIVFALRRVSKRPSDELEVSKRSGIARGDELLPLN